MTILEQFSKWITQSFCRHSWRYVNTKQYMYYELRPFFICDKCRKMMEEAE